MAGLGALEARMKNIGKNVEINAGKKKQAQSRAILKELVSHTPVLSGLAKGNWQVTVNRPASVPIKRKSKSGTVVLSDGNRRIKRTKTRESIFITNLVPYIRRLNEGSSKQAPAGFVELAILAGRLSADKIKLVK